jgi:hypothetical protein
MTENSRAGSKGGENPLIRRKQVNIRPREEPTVYLIPWKAPSLQCWLLIIFDLESSSLCFLGGERRVGFMDEAYTGPVFTGPHIFILC